MIKLRFHPVNHLSQVGEFFFVLGHDIAFKVAGMQIQPDLLEGHAILRKTSQAVFKEAAIVRLEMDFAIFWQNLLESVQEALISQAALFMPLLGPRVREIQIESVNLRIRKIVG